MPTKNFHSCTLRSARDFAEGSLRVIARPDKSALIVGRLAAQTNRIAPQGVRYPTVAFTAEQARENCKAAGGMKFAVAQDAPSSSMRLPLLTPRGVKALGEAAIALLAANGEVEVQSECVLEYAYAEQLENGKWGCKRMTLAGSVLEDIFPDQRAAEEYALRVNGAEIAATAYSQALLASPVALASETASKPLDTYDLPDVEILAAGTWRSMSGQEVTITRADLAAMAENFIKLRDKIKPFLKLGHIKDQDQEKATGFPALGWLENVRVVGTKLVADVKKVPGVVKKLIEAGAFRRISAEVSEAWQDPTTGKVYRPVLRSAGILGATPPAVSTLKDIVALYGSDLTDELSVVSGSVVWPNDALVYALSDHLEEGDSTMHSNDDLKELRDRLDKMEADNKTRAAADTRLREVLGLSENDDPIKAISDLKAANEKQTKLVAEQETKRFSDALDAALVQAVKDGKMLPSMEPGIRAMVRGWQREASENGGMLSFALSEKVTIKGDVLTCLADYFKHAEQLAKPGTERLSGDRSKQSAVSVPGDVAAFMEENEKVGNFMAVDSGSAALHEQITAYAKEHKLSFSDAMIQFAVLTVPEVDMASAANKFRAE